MKELGVSHSTFTTIWKDREKIPSRFEQSSLKIKRVRSFELKDIDKALLTWFKLQRSNKLPISELILQAFWEI